MWCFWVKTFYEVFLFIFTVAVDFAMYRTPSARIKEAYIGEDKKYIEPQICFSPNVEF